MKYKGICVFHSETGTEGGYWAFMDEEYMGGRRGWDYKGLHILKTGDILTIYHKKAPSEVAWHGEVDLEAFDVFQEDAYDFWIHSDQKDVPREVWALYFLEEWPAELVTED